MISDVITLDIAMCVAPEQLEQAIQLLISRCGRIEAKPGCQSVTVLRDACDACRINYRETWTTETDFRRHLRSEAFRHVLVAMEMCRETPEVVIGNFSGTSGFDYLQQLCSWQEDGETRKGMLPAESKKPKPRRGKHGLL